MDLKTLKTVKKALDNQRQNLYNYRRCCCSWEAPQLDWALECNKYILSYIGKHIKREETLLKKKAQNGLHK